jgi:uncharacterized membrane protein
MTVSVEPSVGETAIASINTSQLNNFTTEPTLNPATLVNVLLLVTATGQVGPVHVGGVNDWQNLTFNASEIQNGTIQQADTTDIVNGSISSLVTTLSSINCPANNSLCVQVLGLGLNTGQLTSGILSSLNAVASPLNSVVNNLTGLLGVGLGVAYVRPDGVRCQDPVLAQ